MIPTLTSAEALLALLHESPAHRLVEFYASEAEEGHRVLAVDAEGLARVIAQVAEGSPAEALLNEAYELVLADADRLPTTPARWATLPLCYGPYCSTWVLHAHPLAPRAPTDHEARGEPYRGWAEMA